MGAILSAIRRLTGLESLSLSGYDFSYGSVIDDLAMLKHASLECIDLSKNLRGGIESVQQLIENTPLLCELYLSDHDLRDDMAFTWAMR